MVCISVKGKSVGKVMYESKERKGLTASPIKFHLTDTPQIQQLKALICMMISFEPSDRPSIDEVLQKLQNIAGIYIIYSLKCYF